MLRKTKGQFSIEYLLAFVLFSIVVLYLSFQASGVLFDVITERSVSRKDSEAHRIADFLAETEEGFASDPYHWDSTKVHSFTNSCDEKYEEVLEDVGLSERSGLRIIKYKKGEGVGDEMPVCVGPPVPAGVTLATTSRFGYLEDDGIYKMEVAVW